jgi:hypothetical protein
MDVALPLAATLVESSNAPTEAGKATNSLNRSKKSSNKFITFYINPMQSTRNTIITIRSHISLKWEKMFGFTCRKNAL